MKKGIFRLPKTYSVVKCKCGRIIHFHHNFPAICRNCGRRVCPTKLYEFREKIKKSLIKKGDNMKKELLEENNEQSLFKR